MKRIFVVIVFVVMALCLASSQEKPTAEAQPQSQERPLSFYKVEYILRELQDGKAINSRSYVMTIENGDRGEAKVGARVPVNAGGGNPNLPATQFQYMDVGVNINCRVVGQNDFVTLHTTVEISSFALPEASGTTGQPVVRQMRTQMAAVVAVGKQTVIGIIDDVNSTKRYEVGVTATKLK